MIHVICIAGYPTAGYPVAFFVKEQMELAARIPDCRVSYLAVLPDVPFFLRTIHRYQKYAEIDARLKNECYEVRRIPRYWPLPGGQKAWPFNALQLAANAAPLIRRLLKRYPGDRFIIHSHWLLPTGLAGVILAKKFKLPHVCTARHGSMLEDSKKSPLLRRLYQTVLKYSDFCVAVSEDQKAQVRELNKNIETAVIHNGTRRDLFFPLEPRARDELRRKLAGIDRETKLIFAPRVNETSKGLWELLEAFRREREAGRNIFLSIISHEKETEAACSFLAKNGLEKSAYISRGWISREEIIPWFQAADLLTLPSYAEGMPNAMIEAMACRVPAAVTPVGGVPTVLRHGETGFSLKIGSVESVVEALELLFTNPQWYEQVVEKAARLVEEKFEMRRSAEKLVEIYRKLLHFSC
jgi:glycosyltransferase involved in cell wall biosynthesis